MKLRPRRTLLLLLGIAACQTEDEPMSTTTADIQGAPEFTACSAVDIATVDRAVHVARIASQSAAFQGCLAQRLPSYSPCSDDPAAFRAAALAARLTMLLEAAQSDNGVALRCDGTLRGAKAWAQLQLVGPIQQEAITLRRGWLDMMIAQLAAPRVCGPTEAPPAGCRTANEPWGEIASVVWHESMHNHHFAHDVTASADFAALDCMAGIPPLNLDQSVPHIVGQCIHDVVWSAGQRCGDQQWCGTNGMSMPDAWLSTTCTCIEDAGPACYDIHDRDGDGRGDRCDACPAVANETPTDGDRDGTPDACDNCRLVANATQADGDRDAVGDACDNCRFVANATQTDTDLDGPGDACDNCPATWNRSQSDLDGDKLGDRCDPDRDGDGLLDTVDLCPAYASTNNGDADHDGIGDPCDGCDLARNLTFDCAPLTDALRWALDDRLEAFAEELARFRVAGPWGPWEPFLRCAWKCDTSAARHAARKAVMDSWIAANPGKPIAEAALRSLLLGEEGATPGGVDRFLKDRLQGF